MKELSEIAKSLLEDLGSPAVHLQDHLQALQKVCVSVCVM